MCNGIRAGKYRTGLTMKTAAVGKEYRVFRGVLLGQHRPLADKGFAYYCAVVDFAAAAADKILREDAWAYINRYLRPNASRPCRVTRFWNSMVITCYQDSSIYMPILVVMLKVSVPSMSPSFG